MFLLSSILGCSKVNSSKLNMQRKVDKVGLEQRLEKLEGRVSEIEEGLGAIGQDISTMKEQNSRIEDQTSKTEGQIKKMGKNNTIKMIVSVFSSGVGAVTTVVSALVKGCSGVSYYCCCCMKVTGVVGGGACLYGGCCCAYCLYMRWNNYRKQW